jgi:hypothetical protein
MLSKGPPMYVAVGLDGETVPLAGAAASTVVL